MSTFEARDDAMDDWAPDADSGDGSKSDPLAGLYLEVRPDIDVARSARRVSARVITRLERRRRRRVGARLASAAALVLAAILVFSRAPSESGASPVESAAGASASSGASSGMGEHVAPTTTVELARETSQDAIERLLGRIRTGSPYAARRAIAELVRVDGEPASEVELRLASLSEAHAARRGRFDLGLDELLASPSAAVRVEGLRLLAMCSPRETCRRLWRELDATDAASRAVVAGALERIGGGALVAFAAEARQQTETRRRRLVAVLEELTPEPAGVILASLLDDAGPEPFLIDAAARCGDPRALPWLSRWARLADGRGQAAVEAIGRIPGREAAAILVQLHSDTALRALAPAYRAALAEALRRRQDDVFAIIRAGVAAQETTGPRARPAPEALLALLVDVFPREAPRELEALIDERTERLRPFLFRALARLESELAVGVLLRSLHRPATRALARRSLARIAGRDLGPDPIGWERWARQRAGTVPEASSADDVRRDDSVRLATLF